MSNLRVEIFISITLNRKRTALAVTVEGRQGRKQFCAFSARARFHTAWVKNRHQAANDRCPLVQQQRTCVERAAPTASGASLPGFAVTGLAMIGTGSSDCIGIVTALATR
jgi:hypothetical protein